MSGLIGGGPAFHAILEQINMVSTADCTVLLCGETGTGKEVVANAIHSRSARQAGPYVKVNCAAMPAGLIESELFGHERGAFTGALTQTNGRFQRANRGTLLLDEVGDLPLELQPKLLRVIQEQEFERLGSGQTIRVDVRVIAATSLELSRMVRERQFRADLYYRLNVFPISLPPLRERREDIPMLVYHFVRQFSDRMRKDVRHVPDSVLRTLQQYDWPGNIRELQNWIERAVITSQGPDLQLSPERFGAAPAEFLGTVENLADAERVHIQKVLRLTGGIVGGRNGAAVRLGVPRTTLLSRMQRLGIAPKGPLSGDSSLQESRALG